MSDVSCCHEKWLLTFTISKTTVDQSINNLYTGFLWILCLFKIFVVCCQLFLASTASRWGFSFFIYSFVFFFRRLISNSEVIERILTKLGHAFTYDCYLKNLVRTTPGIYSPRAGDKNTFLGPALNFDGAYLCNRTRYQQSERNLSICRDSPTCHQIWWTLVLKRLRTVGAFLPISLNFCIGRPCQPYRMDII